MAVPRKQRSASTRPASTKTGSSQLRRVLPVSTAEPQPRPDKPLFLTIKPQHSLVLGEETVAEDSLGLALDAASGNDKGQRFSCARTSRSITGP